MKYRIKPPKRVGADTGKPNKKQLKTQPRHVTYNQIKKTEELLSKIKISLVITTGIYNTIASYAMTDAVERMQKFDEWNKVKDRYNDILHIFDYYEKRLRTTVLKQMFPLLRDMVDAAYEQTERQRKEIYSAMIRTATRKGARHPINVARAFFAFYCLEYAALIFKSYRRSIMKKCGIQIDMTQFWYANLEKAQNIWQDMMLDIDLGGLTCRDFEADEDFQTTLSNFFLSLSNEDFIESIAQKGIDQNAELVNNIR